jgi:hypothetical protein
MTANKMFLALLLVILSGFTGTAKAVTMDFDTGPYSFGLFLNEFLHGTYTQNGFRLQNTAVQLELS